MEKMLEENKSLNYNLGNEKIIANIKKYGILKIGNILYLGEKIMKEKNNKVSNICCRLGTRILLATKAQPKEMLVIADKPALQYLVEELVDSGIEEIFIIIGGNKTSIENYFDYSFELGKTLEEKGKKDLLKVINDISKLANIYYVKQKNTLGLGHAIGCAKTFVGVS